MFSFWGKNVTCSVGENTDLNRGHMELKIKSQ